MSMTERATRETTFDEEYEILQAEKNELFAEEDENAEPPFANCVVRRALRCIRKLKEEREQYREYREIFESHFTEDALKLFSDKEEFSKWFERGKWHVLKCDELGREVEQYRAIGTVSEFQQLKEKVTAKKPIHNGYGVYFCPKCHGSVWQIPSESHCCFRCGTVLDWSKGKE